MEYLVASIGQWNKDLFDKYSDDIDGEWFFCSSPSELTTFLEKKSPRYIFFPHWRWIVPLSVIEKYECICFHMTDVPYGRGGSPLQNLIVRGYKNTVLTALKMEETLDTGPVYFKEALPLHGSAEDIYTRAADLTWGIIKKIIEKKPLPITQKGKITEFKRRKPDESEIPAHLSLDKLYDYIRMLDAPGYPKAFINSGRYSLEFDHAKFEENILSATVTIKIKE